MSKFEHKPLTRKRPLKKCKCGEPRKKRLSRCVFCAEISKSPHYFTKSGM
jgi:hypothetical protein